MGQHSTASAYYSVVLDETLPVSSMAYCGIDVPSHLDDHYSDSDSEQSGDESGPGNSRGERWDQLFNYYRKNEKSTEIEALVEHFSATASMIAKVIIGEYHLPNSQKLIKPINNMGIAGGNKYMVHGLFFKQPTDKQLIPG
eukprot:TRINITY_DN6724_c0_g5_i1.p1 TRINITY_DN6724_c0_g5~~TRINITY_DN6724_c0_g5_i1.p1  ORF type:complete len:141 (-),score=27.62 TRINITY_DN6724_c0_g5_i1:46-468(-)